MSEATLRSRIGRQTALYGLGIVLGKALSFVSLPIFTRLLTPADYGVIALIELTFDMLTIIAGSRLGVGLFRFYHKATDDRARHAVIGTALILLFSTFSAVAIAAWFAAPFISRVIFDSAEYVVVIRIAALSFPWAGIMGVPLGFLRLKERAGIFVAIGIVKSLLQLGFVVILLVPYDMGIRGVFLSTLAANTLVGVPLVIAMLRQTGLHWSRSSAADLVRFGTPLIITQVATFFTTFGDRYFLQASWDQTTVGIYALAYTFGFLLITVGFTPFGSVWEPMRFEIATRDDRNDLFARAFVLMNLLLMSVAVGIGVYAHDVLRIMSDYAFWGAAPLVPILLLAYVLQGWAAFHDTGIHIVEKTRYITIANWAAALAALVGYGLLIPPFAGWGAAFTTVAAFAVRSWLIYRFSQQLWPIRYTWSPVLRLAALAVAAVGGVHLLPELPLLPSIAVRTSVVCAFFAGVWLFDIVPAAERDLLRRVLRNRLRKVPVGSSQV